MEVAIFVIIYLFILNQFNKTLIFKAICFLPISSSTVGVLNHIPKQKLLNTAIRSSEDRKM